MAKNVSKWKKVGESGYKSMLIGHYTTKVSLKGRVALPKKFRQEIGNKIIVTAGYEKSLIVVSPQSWQAVLGQVTNRPLTIKSARATDRFLLGSAFEIELDDQGRFIIPPYLRKYADITEDIVFSGIGNRVEIWSQSRWSEYEKYLEENIEDIAEKLSSLE